MLKILNTLLPCDSPEQMCLRLGELLGMNGPVPVAVMRRALVDDQFAFRLVNCRGQDALLRILFSDERNRQYEGEAADVGSWQQPGLSSPPSAETPSNLQLAWKAGKAVARWGASGFRKVQPEVFAARFNACQACEYLGEPSGRFVYKVKLRKDSDQRICTACGCVASRKASLPTESCPMPHPRDAGLNRWGEPLRKQAAGEAADASQS